MRVLFIVLLIVLNGVSLAIPYFAFAEEGSDVTSKVFLVTAYYSPLPNQRCYLRGNYESERRLNGNGTNGASGKEVYAGMLAGPKTYTFGTKIYLQGIGVGTIDDRWGAIVPSGSRNMKYDRLDIWVGKGEEGLVRALNWGKRVVSGTILSSGIAQMNAITFSSIAGVSNLEQVCGRLSKKTAPTQNSIEAADLGLSLFDKTIIATSTKADILELQSILTRLGYYHDELNGIYDKSITDAIYTFQFEYDLVESYFDLGAGVFGPKTRSAMKEVYQKWQTDELKRQETLGRAREEIVSYMNDVSVTQENEIGEHVRKLQKILSFLGYFKEKDTAIYGQKTKSAVVQYQLDKQIVSASTSPQAGVVGPKTKEVLIGELLQKGFKSDDN